MAPTAQEEFDELMRDKAVRTTHPEDDAHHTNGHDYDNDGQSFLNLSDSDNEGRRTPVASAPNHHRSHNDNNDDDNDYHYLRNNHTHTHPRPSTSQSRHTIPLTRYDANTGPKGVIADAQNFRDSRRLHRVSLRGAPVASRLPPLPLGPTFTEKKDDDDDANGAGSDADDEGLEDAAFMQKWRVGRLKELQSGVRDGGGGGGGAAGQNRARKSRVWGGMAAVDGMGFLDAVDRSPPDTVVVVYIYDDYSEVSLAVEECMRDLAVRHLDARFVKLHFEDAEMEPAGVPAVLAYQSGDKFAGLVPLIQEIPDDAELSAETLERVLKRYQILR